MQHTSLPAAGAIARPIDGSWPHARTPSAVLRPALEMLLLALLSALIGRGAATGLPRIARTFSATLLCRLALATRAYDGWDGAWEEEWDEDEAAPHRPLHLSPQGHGPLSVYVEHGLVQGWMLRCFPNRGMHPAAAPRPRPHPAHPLPDH